MDLLKELGLTKSSDTSGIYQFKCQRFVPEYPGIAIEVNYVDQLNELQAAVNQLSKECNGVLWKYSVRKVPLSELNQPFLLRGKNEINEPVMR